MALSRPVELPDGDGKVLAILREHIEYHRQIIEKNKQHPSVAHTWVARLHALEAVQKKVDSIL